MELGIKPRACSSEGTRFAVRKYRIWQQREVSLFEHGQYVLSHAIASLCLLENDRIKESTGHPNSATMQCTKRFRWNAGTSSSRIVRQEKLRNSLHWSKMHPAEWDLKSPTRDCKFFAFETLFCKSFTYDLIDCFGFFVAQHADPGRPSTDVHTRVGEMRKRKSSVDYVRGHEQQCRSIQWHQEEVLYSASRSNASDLPAHHYTQRWKCARIDVNCYQSGNSDELQTGWSGLDGWHAG